MFKRVSTSAVFLGVFLSLPLIWWLELGNDDIGAIALLIFLCVGAAMALLKLGQVVFAQRGKDAAPPGESS